MANADAGPNQVYFDKAAAEYDTRFQAVLDKLEEEIRAKVGVIGFRQGGRLLDYACGTGPPIHDVGPSSEPVHRSRCVEEYGRCFQHQDAKPGPSCRPVQRARGQPDRRGRVLASGFCRGPLRGLRRRRCGHGLPPLCRLRARGAAPGGTATAGRRLVRRRIRLTRRARHGRSGRPWRASPWLRQGPDPCHLRDGWRGAQFRILRRAARRRLFTDARGRRRHGADCVSGQGEKA